MLDQSQHASVVNRWLKRSEKGLEAVVLLRLFEAALEVLWTQTRTTLGDVTLTAISVRVLHNAREKFPLFCALEVDPVGGIVCGDLGATIIAGQRAELIEGIRFTLLEYLTVVGHLTAEILTPELHSALLGIAAPAARAGKKDRPTPTDPPDAEGEDPDS